MHALRYHLYSGANHFVVPLVDRSYLGHIVPYGLSLSSRTASGTCADAKQRKKTLNTLLIFSNVVSLVPESRLAPVIYNARKHSRSSNAPLKVQISLLTLDQCT